MAPLRPGHPQVNISPRKCIEGALDLNGNGSHGVAVQGPLGYSCFVTLPLLSFWQIPSHGLTPLELPPS
eukprot:scaffold75613_cov24-Tisochrysis_lutea.AAC.3